MDDLFVEAMVGEWKLQMSYANAHTMNSNAVNRDPLLDIPIVQIRHTDMVVQKRVPLVWKVVCMTVEQLVNLQDHEIDFKFYQLDHPEKACKELFIKFPNEEEEARALFLLH